MAIRVFDQQHKGKDWKWPVLILVAGALAFAAVVQCEAPAVYQLWTSPWPMFREIMSRSVYEGGAVGASDVSVTIAVLAFFKWIRNKRAKIESQNTEQIRLKFIWLTALCTSFATVHSLKWLISRARPKVFFSHEIFPRYTLEQLESVQWAGFMPWNGTRGMSWNSFPSGHTATATILLIGCYLYWSKSRSLSVIMWMIFTIFAVAMGVARSMAGMHWLSDSVASYFLVWSIIHIFSMKMKIHST